MSDTPRTDAAAVSSEYIRREMDYYTQKFVLADVARHLERENEALRKKLSYYEAITTGAEHKVIDAAIKEQSYG